MKLDYSCARDILLFLEQNLKISVMNGAFCFDQLEINEVCKSLSKYERETIVYTTVMLEEAGYIETAHSGHDGIIGCIKYKRITFEGHQYLDSIRKDSIWSGILSTVKEKGVSLTFDIIKSIAIERIKAAMH